MPRVDFDDFRFINWHKRSTQVGEVDHERGCARAGAGSIWELSVPSNQCCCEPKSALKTRVCFSKKDTIKRVRRPAQDRPCSGPWFYHSLNGSAISGKSLHVFEPQCIRNTGTYPAGILEMKDKAEHRVAQWGPSVLNKSVFEQVLGLPSSPCHRTTSLHMRVGYFPPNMTPSRPEQQGPAVLDLLLLLRLHSSRKGPVKL